MQALILAAGWATRLGGMARDRPKHLLPVGERLAIDFVVERVEEVEAVRDIHVITHDRFAGHFERWADGRAGAPPRVWRNGTRSYEERLGAVGDIQRFLELSGLDDDLLVLGGDNVCDFDLSAMASAARREAAVALYDVGSIELVRRYATVELDDSGRVSRFVEKDPSPRTTLAAVAIYGFPRSILPEVRRYLELGGSPDNLGSFAEWLVEERGMRGHVMHGRWIDVGSPDEYERARREFA